MTKKFKGYKLMTPKFRVSFPKLFKAEEYGGSEPKYSVNMMFPPDTDLKELKTKAKKAAKEFFKGKVKKSYFEYTWRKGSEIEAEWIEGFEDWTFIRAKSTYKPGIVDEDLEEIIDPSEAYPGRWARATISLFSYDKAGSKGVGVFLENIQLLDHDDRFDGRSSASSDFSDDDENDLDDDDDDMLE